MAFNKQSHLENLDLAIAELQKLSARTISPAPLQHQYVGTVVDNTVCLLTAPANSLDQGNRNVTFSEVPNWISAMQAVHRSFYASIHLAVEKALEEYCDSNKVVVESSIKNQADKELEKLLKIIDNEDIKKQTEKVFNKLTKGTRPIFTDYLNTALKNSKMPEEEKTNWRNFFDALTIVRNKSSHSNPQLTDNEIERLRKGGFATLVSSTGGLQINARNYFQICNFTLDFFDMLLKNE